MTTPPVYEFTEISGPAPVTVPVSGFGDEHIQVGRTLHVGDDIMFDGRTSVVITDTTTGDTFVFRSGGCVALEPLGLRINGDCSVRRGSRPEGDGT